MILKVLATGRNRKVIKDICEHLESDRGYITVKCAPSKAALFDITLAELPKVIVICLSDETSETVASFNVLKTVARQGNCTIIVIANHEDEKLFIKYTELSKVLFLSRPISLFALYEKLNQIEEEIANSKENELSAFREYINEEALNGPKRRRILVIDDDSEQLVNIREQLEEFYDVSLIKEPAKTFKYLEKHTPDLILLDYLMPDMDGPEVYRRIREVEEYQDIPIVFLTGMKEKKAVLKTLAELRPQGYIIKPSKKSELVAKIIDVLG